MTVRASAVLTVLLALRRRSAAPARAQGPGVEVGVSGDPSQFYFGGQYEMGPVVDRVWFRPNAEIGVGHDRTLVGLNFEFAYRTPLPRTDWRLLLRRRSGAEHHAGRRRTPVPAAASTSCIGASHEQGLFTQLKVGFMDSPGVRFGVGLQLPLS